MPDAELLLRPARPTEQDGLAFARYLNIASDRAFRYLLGGSFERIIADAFRSEGHDMSYQYVTVAERQEQVVGMASAYSGEQHGGASDEPLRRAAGWRWYRMAAGVAMASGVFDFMEHVPDGDFYLQAVAVDDDQRGQGTGSALIAAVEDDGRAQRCTRLALDVAASNPDAQRLYERLGMAVEAESPRVFWIPGTTALRMVKPL